MSTALSASLAARLRERLLAWYAVAARDLPWRRSRDPYAIWVSEIMLQQTRVDTVLRYYDRFLQRFPTPQALAEASEDAVMAAWSGLGYYRRARLLHSGVREVVAQYGGQVPREAEQRRALPGIGRYTAGAIGSIAFDEPEPLVDGNVARVLCRVLALSGAPEQREVQAQLWDAASALVVGPQPGALNQALMELGATLCTKHAPACARCPLRDDCRALREDRVSELPVVRSKKPPRQMQLVALIARAERGAVWLARGQGSLFGALWNLPMAEGNARTDAAELQRKQGLRGRLGKRAIAAIEHVLTHRHFHVALFEVQDARAEEGSGLRAVRGEELGEIGISSLTHKALSAAGARGSER